MEKAVFLDRDGVINRKFPEGQYLTRPEDLELLPHAAEAIALLNGAHLLAVVVTNQRCIAKGLLDLPGLEAIHDLLRKDLAKSGAILDAIYFCPHEMSADCQCRKPNPGMLLTAAKDLQIDLPHSWMIGDSASDMKAGKRAGCKTAMLVRDERTSFDNADLSGTSLLQIVKAILAREQRHL